MLDVCATSGVETVPMFLLTGPPFLTGMNTMD